MSLSSNIIAPLELRLAEGQPYYSYTKKNTSSDERFDSENHLLEFVLWDSKNKNTDTIRHKTTQQRSIKTFATLQRRDYTQ